MKTIRTILATVLLTVPLLVPALSHAASGSLYLSASTKNVNQGDTFSVAVRVNTGGDGVNAVQANLTYPASMLQFVSISAAGSSFDVSAQGSGGGGAIQIARGAISDVTGDALVATVTFKALLDGGTANVDFSGGSAVVRSSDNIDILTGTSGGRYTLYTFVAKPKTPSSPSTPAAPADTTPPVITAITVTNITPAGATVQWTTDKPSNSAVDYGLDTNYGLSASDTTMTTAHKLTLNSAFLEPVTPYRFRIKSADASGNVATSPDQGFTTAGYSLDVRVLDHKSQPAAGAQVTMANIVKLADSKGIAHFMNLKPGAQLVAGQGGNYSGKTSVTIKADLDAFSKQRPQTATLKLTTLLIAGIPAPIAAALAGGAALLAAGGLWFDITHNYRLIHKIRHTLSRKPKLSAAPINPDTEV
jgi:hypothetical protein